MVPDTPTILRRRHVIGTIIRLAALALLIWVGYRACFVVIAALVGGARLGILIDEGMAFVPGLIVGVFLLVFESRLVRWLVPVPDHSRCPRCGYRLVGITGDRCPECGLPLGASGGPPGEGP